MFFLVLFGLPRHGIVLLDIRLPDYFALDSRVAVNDGNNEENGNRDDMRQSLFEEGRLQHSEWNYSRQNNGILSRNTDFYLNMQVLKLLARVAFICNVCFLLASLILLFPNPPQGHIIRSVIVAGYLMGLPANVIVFGWVIALASSGRREEAELPTWLMVVNGIIFSFQLVLLILHFWT